MDLGEPLLIAALQFEPELRVELRRHLGLGPNLTSDQLEDLLQETYARILSATRESAPNLVFLKDFSFDILRQVVAESSPSLINGTSRDTLPCNTLEDRNQAQRLPDLCSSGPTSEALLSNSILADVVGTLQRSPDRTRQVFTLRKVYGYSQQAISEELSLSIEEVRRHLIVAVRACAPSVFDPSLHTPLKPHNRFGKKLKRRHRGF
jgi:RNA polymerase sigma factor (sigma-70 family)